MRNLALAVLFLSSCANYSTLPSPVPETKEVKIPCTQFKVKLSYSPRAPFHVYVNAITKGDIDEWKVLGGTADINILDDTRLARVR